MLLIVCFAQVSKGFKFPSHVAVKFTTKEVQHYNLLNNSFIISVQGMLN